MVYDIWHQTVDVAHDVNILSMISLDLDTVRGVLTNVLYPSDYIGMIAKVGRIDETPTVKVWESPTTTLGETSGKKFLRELRIRSVGTGTVTLYLDGQGYSYPLTDGVNKVAVMRPFDKLRVRLVFTSTTSRVTSAELTVDHYGE